MATRKPNYTKDGEGHAKNMPATKDEGHKGQITSQADADFFALDKQREVDARETLIPRLAVLEANSPQLDKHAPEYIEGASAGQIADVALNEAWDKVLILPAHYAVLYLEWAPRDSGEGLVHNYLTDSKVYDSLVPDERQKRFLPNGNEIVQTGTIYCLNLNTVTGRPCFFPMSSTRFQASKRWNTMQLEDYIKNSSGAFVPSAMFYRTWEVECHRKEKKGNKWHVPTISKGIPIQEYDPTLTLAKKAKAFGEQIAEQIRLGTIALDLQREGDEGEEAPSAPRDKAKERL